MQVAQGQGMVRIAHLCKLQLVKDMHSVYPSHYPECSTLDYTLHYISMVFCNLHCIKGKVFTGHKRNYYRLFVIVAV